MDPNVGKTKQVKMAAPKFSMARLPQCPFNPKQVKCGDPQPLDGFAKPFIPYKNNYYRKGFVYKPFKLKQIESQNVRPTPAERELFLSTFNMYSKNEDDSSENDVEWTRTFLKRDSGIDIGLGDKILVRDGELQGAKGPIVNFDDNGKTVMFKPNNLDGWDDVLGIDRSSVVKYVDPGDSVKIVEGKYQGYTGLVMSIGENETMPIVRIDSTKQEHQISTNHLKCIKPRE